MSRIHLLAALAAAVALPSAAGTRIEYVDSQSGAPQTVISIQDGRIRMDDAGIGTYTLFDRRTGALTTVNEDDETYTVMDEAAMKQVSGQVSSAMAEMRKQLEQMPPEQRAMMEKMMGGAADMGRTALEVSIERTGNRLEKSGYDCEQVFLAVGTMSRSEMCVADPDDIDIPAGDRETLAAMTELMKVFAENMSQGLGMDVSYDMDSLGGFPVYTRVDGEKSADVLKAVTQDGLDASLFEVPDGYREETFAIGE